MSLELRDYHGGFFAEVVAIPWNTTGPVASNGIPFSVVSWDPMPRLLANMAVSLGYRRVEETLKVYPDTGSPDIVTHAVRPHEPRYSGTVDWARYGSRLNDFSAAVRLLRGERISAFAPDGEKDVRHANYRGVVGPGLGRSPLYSAGEDGVVKPQSYVYGAQPLSYFTYGEGDWLYHNANLLQTAIGLDAKPPFLGRVRTLNVQPTATGFFFSNPRSVAPGYGAPGMTEYWDQYTYGDMVQFLKQFEDFPERVYRYSWRYGGGHPTYGLVMRIYMSHVSVKLGDPSGPLLVSVRYDIRQESGYSLTLPLNPAANHVWRDWTFNWSFYLTSVAGPQGYLPTNGGTQYDLTMSNVYSTKIEYEAKVVGEGYMNSNSFIGWSSRVPLGYTYKTTTVRTNSANYHSFPIESEGRGASLVPRFESFLKRGRNVGFAARVDRDFHDIRPSALLSTSDAMDSLIPSIDQNLIEALTQVGTLFDVFPDVGKAFRALFMLSTGRPIQSFADMVDVVSDYYLKLKWGVVPNIDLLQNQLPRISRIIRIASELEDKGIVTSRGTFKHEFSNEFDRPHVSLVTRTKLVALMDNKSILANVLGVKALGVLPAPSNAWDLIPFSFVADWFFNIGQRLSDIENVSLLSLANIQSFTHSYLLQSYITDEELAMDGLAKSNLVSAEDPRLWYYKREVSAYLPPVRDSKFDFRAPARAPFWAISGSLGWQLLRRS